MGSLADFSLFLAVGFWGDMTVWIERGSLFADGSLASILRWVDGGTDSCCDVGLGPFEPISLIIRASLMVSARLEALGRPSSLSRCSIFSTNAEILLFRERSCLKLSICLERH